MYRTIAIYLNIFVSGSFVLATQPDTAFQNQFRREIGGWIAADATYSILLPDGRTLWLFGDTFIGEVDENNAIIPGSKLIRNSGVIQNGGELQTLFNGTRSAPTDLMYTPNPDSTWYWPEHGLVENDTLRIFAAKFRHDPNGPPGFQFAHAGNDIANFTYPGLQFINSVPVRCHEKNQVLYGDRVLVDSGFVYIYGRRNDHPDIDIPYPHVARAPIDSLMKQQWEFYTGKGWSADPEETTRINDFQVSQQYSVTSYHGKYILLTQDIWLLPEIWTFTSWTPVGPWENKKRIYTTPETSQDMFTYNAYAHPQFDRDGELLISYNTNGDFWSIFDNVEIYRPRFIRVPYMNMDYTFWPNGTGSSVAGEAQGFMLYPNPVTDRATIVVDHRESPGEARIELVDLQGRVVRSLFPVFVNRGLNRLVIDLEGLSGGIYFCRCTVRQEIRVVRLVKTNTLNQ